MNNATENQTGHWPVRNAAAAAEQQRSREMPLLFQLGDANRQLANPPAVTSPATTSLATSLPIVQPVYRQQPAYPQQPAPIDLPKPSSFPLASSVVDSALDAWPRTTSALFEMPTELSTAALAIGAAVNKEDAKPIAIAIPAATVITDKPVEKPTSPPITTGLPAAIESAVKAASEPTETVATKIEVKSEPLPAKAEAKSDSKPEAKAEPAKTETAGDKPSPASLRRQRAEARQAKVNGGKESDWLQSHGKVIAICFVLALIGTIYLARRNRGTAPLPDINTPNLAVEIPGEHNHELHPTKPTEAANAAPRLVEAPSHPLDTTPSPATPAEAVPPASSTAELQPPVVPNAGQSTTPPTSEPLFPWQNDSRVATRPEGTQNAPAAPVNNAPPTAPALNAPTYPETNLRDAPLLPPAPPSTAPAAPPTGQGGSSGRVPARHSPASFTSAPGGNRYERTGSGLY